MSGSFVFSTDEFDFEIEVDADCVGDMDKLSREVALDKAKTLAKAEALRLLIKVCAQIDAQTFDDTYDVDEPEYSY